MTTKSLSSKMIKFFKMPNSMKQLYIRSLFDRLNTKKKLVEIIYRLTNENRTNIISVVDMAQKSKCLIKIVTSCKETTGTLWVWELMFIQALVCIIKPDIVLETGVAHGSSSAMILEAMEFNGKGKLYSIDLPVIEKRGKPIPFIKNYKFRSEDISAVDQEHPTGWFVPQHLRHRWELILGDSLVELPKLLRNLEYIDMFHHDSLHLYEHMTKEFTSVWPKIKTGGYLASHDMFTKNHTAIVDFADKMNRKVYSFWNEGIIIK